ncbi:CDP-glycerol:poly(glycerophosphate) glycerophosphotransferase [Brevibacterium aurantiacum]|uniref:CDP-glycerol:poly(Glycerophosphate) glycerophosphotransferase n=1 Tax=Brevibacterium aurantiacum TaxID=273384 RepID=A0A1D7W741_BREAU|nr:CDP-glycerol:poly(glycerophosphate) glycerophosphotransferase [Brevibacterium aurantiacum]RCS95738.1 CDP-glycerol:glycerophosphate glycerophosphotransferase [Brevibacterium aurantiacum]
MSNFAATVRARIGRLKAKGAGSLRRRVYDNLPVDVRAVVRRAVEKDELFPSQRHTVTVIVPVYNVEEYLGECLRSIVNQTYTNLEVIIVDDGSTDSSGAICAHYARSDRRVRIITQENAGLGAARNTGLRAASGEFVVFADSDDIVPPHAYRTMLDSLLNSGSDFVVGSYYRFTELRQYTPKWVKDAHSEPILGARSRDFLNGLANVFAWNKMFRAEFISRIGLQFPEGIRYEDQYPITRAYLLADSFDVIPEKIYKWRIRFDGSSITQNKGSLEDIIDRAEVIRSVHAYVAEHADKEFQEYWLAKVLGMDLIPYISESLHADEEYRENLRGLIGSLNDGLPDSVLEKIKVKARCTLFAFEHGTVEELGHVMLANREIGNHLPTEVVGESVRFAPDYLTELSIEFPESLLVLSRDELVVEHAINRLRWTEDSLVIDGWAFVRNIDLRSVGAPHVTMYLESALSGRRAVMNLESGHDFVSRSVRSKWPDYDPAAFSASIDRAALIAIAAARDSLSLRLTIEHMGISEDIDVTKTIRNGSAGRLEAFVSDDGKVFRPILNRVEGVSIEIDAADVAIQSIARAQSGFTLEAASKLPAIAVLTSLKVGRKSRWNRAPVSINGQIRHLSTPRTSAGFNEMLPKKRPLSMISGRSSHPVYLTESALPGSIEVSSSNSQALVRSRRATAEIVRRGPYGHVESLELNGLRLTISGTVLSEERPTVTLRSKTHMIDADVVEFDGPTFRAEFKLRYDLFGEERRLPYGGYLINFGSKDSSVALLPGRELGSTLPGEIRGDNYRLRLTKTKNGALWLTFSFASTDEETGALNQARLQRWHRKHDFEVIPNTVFFQSYLGEQATDSALAIHHELRRRYPNLALYWGVTDPSVPLPEGGIPVVLYTREWYEILSRAEYLVNNIYFFSWFIKRPYQTYIQTWHGTPLKKIGRSYWEDRNREPVWIERMDRQARGWDFLVTPNAFCTEKFAEEFRYPGKVLEAGYPRNDVLALPDSGTVSAVRSKLGIGAGKKVVLYAPTWRDSQSAKAWMANMVTFIDLQDLSADLGEEYVILVRGHGHNARAGSSVESKGSVIDVTYYPEINDLYLAADLAITDYSSVMFDFAVTRKPMVFFAPDLAEYSEGVRGFYFDYESTVPGPVIENAADVAPAVRRMLSDEFHVDDAYKKFVSRFCSNDDGHAAERVVGAVWGSSR